MVLLEVIRGGTDVTGDLDEIRKNGLLVKSDNIANLTSRHLEDVTKLDLSRAHEFCRACVPRRVYEEDPSKADGVARDSAGKPIRRLRQSGDKGVPKLYSIFGLKNSHEALYDFGIGVGLYFHQLIEFIILCLVLTLINLPLLLCNSAFKLYLGGVTLPGQSTPMKPAEFCGLTFEGLQKQYARGKNMSGMDMKDYVTLKNNGQTMDIGDFGQVKTEVTILQGICELCTIVCMVLFIFFSKKVHDKYREKIDLSQQTAQDYGVCITSKSGYVPKDADAIKAAYAELLPQHPVVSVSIVYDNRKLFRSLRQMVIAFKTLQKKRILAIRSKKNPKTKEELDAIEAECKVRAKQGEKMVQTREQKYFRMGRDFTYWAHAYYERLQEINVMNEAIAADANRTPRAAYIVFDNEHGARAACSLYSKNAWQRLNLCGMTAEIQNVKTQLEAGQDPLVTDLIQACDHNEADEPTDIIWENIGVRSIEVSVRSFISWVSAGTVCVILFFVLVAMKDAARTNTSNNGAVDEVLAVISGATIVVLNQMLPKIMKASCMIEVHKDKTALEKSMMTKLSLVRFFNTAIMTFLLTPAGEILDPSTITNVQAILIADLIYPAISRLLDIYNLVMRYGVARTATHQAAMNEYFRGTEWKLAERYTDTSKTIYVAFFYGAIIPSGYAICAATCLVTYIVDKYLLLRRWREPPKYDESMAERSRIMLLLGVLSHVCMTAFFFQNWPFICNKGDERICEQSVFGGGGWGVRIAQKYYAEYGNTETFARIIFVCVIVVIIFTAKETIYAKIRAACKAICKDDSGGYNTAATNLTYSTRETIDTYEPRFPDLPPLDNPCVFHRGKYLEPTGFSNYMHEVVCKRMADFTENQRWKFAGQTSKLGTPFSAKKIFEVQFWFTQSTIDAMPEQVAAKQALAKQQALAQQQAFLQQQQQQSQLQKRFAQQMAAPGIALSVNSGQMSVQVPPGMGPGSLLNVQTPNGMVQARVPPGVGPGMSFSIQVSAPQASYGIPRV